MPRLHTLPVLAPATLLLLTLAPPARAEKVDVVVLRNGTRVVGELKSMGQSRIELGTDDMGTLKIEWGEATRATTASRPRRARRRTTGA